MSFTNDLIYGGYLQFVRVVPYDVVSSFNPRLSSPVAYKLEGSSLGLERNKSDLSVHHVLALEPTGPCGTL